MATAAELQAEIRRLQERYRIAQNGLATLNKNLQSNQAILARYTDEVSNIPGQVASLESQINAIQIPPPATASQAASDDAPRGPNKSAAVRVTNGRIAPQSTNTAPTNADTTTTSDTGGTTGTDAPTRTTEQTQATDQYAQGINVRAEDGTLSNLRKNPETGELYDPGGIPGGVDLTTSMGVAAAKDDGTPPSISTNNTNVNTSQNAPIQITPQPNILDQYSSYAWSASVYLMSGGQYTRLMNSKEKKIDGYYLLFQSGGAGVSDGVVRPRDIGSGAGGANDEHVFDPASTDRTSNFAAANRSPFFPNDFYIDSVTLDHQIVGKGTGAAHMSSNLKFTVIEPQGITLLDRMYDAVANFEPLDSTGKVNYTAATYLMVLRFYGYDESGNIVYPIKGGLESPVSTSDPSAVVEKFIPFIISRVNWTIGSRTVAYDFEAAPVGQNIGGGSARGTIPYDVQLVDSTVGGLLGGDAKYGTGTAPSTDPGKSTTTGYVSDSEQIANIRNNEQSRLRAAQAAPGSGSSYTPPPPTTTAAPTPKKTITQGLMGAMNDFQQELVRKGTYTVADEYSINFVGIPGMASAADISGAKIQLPNVKHDMAKTGSSLPATKNTQSLKQNANPINYDSRSFSITAGQQILQAIELAVRNSSYISKQKLVIQDANGDQEINQQTTKQVTWFTISMSCERKKFDPKRNDYAYKIKYTVSPYLVKNMDSQYFPITKFSGVHKSYPFWFTGQNTSVKDYQETLNTMFTATLSGSAPGTSLNALANQKYTSSMQDLVKYVYSPRSDETSFGADGKQLEANANGAEVLYNQSDLAEAKVRIIGDPGWIMQGSQFQPLTQATVYPAAKKGFEADGSISFDSQDIMFEMVWQRPEDYDLTTGLADPYAKQTGTGKRQPLQSRVYIATKVTSEFKGGSFEQTLNGSLYRFPLPSGKNTANSAAAASTAAGDSGRNGPDQSGAETARLARQNNDAVTRTKKANEVIAGRTDFSNKAAVLGAQGAYQPAQFAQNNPGGAAFGNPSLTRQGITAGTVQLQPAGSPGAPTDGAGGDVGTTNSPEAPPKLPSSPIARANAAAAARGNQGRGSQSPGNPTSTTNAGNQPINRSDN